MDKHMSGAAAAFAARRWERTPKAGHRAGISERSGRAAPPRQAIGDTYPTKRGGGTP